MKKKAVEFIGVEMGWGAQRHETAWAPESLSEKLNISFSLRIEPSQLFQQGEKISYREQVKEVQIVCQRLSQAISTCLSQEKFPIILGGDESIGIGTWTGVIAHYHSQQKFGLIWIDAHMDAHSPSTSPSMAIHGMPIAVLLGQGEKSLVDLGNFSPKLDPAHLVLIGIRSYEPEEAEFLRNNKVKIYYIEEVLQRGFFTVLKEGVEYITPHTVGFGVNVDLDAFDVSLAPGVGSPVPNGITDLSEITQAFSWLQHHSMLKALEISEYNPRLDKDGKTLQLIQRLLQPWLSKTGTLT